MPSVSQRDALATLTKERLVELARGFELEVPVRSSKYELVEALAHSHRASFERILGTLGRDELKAICRAGGLDDSGRAKEPIIDRILGREDAPHLPGIFAGSSASKPTPEPVDDDEEESGSTTPTVEAVARPEPNVDDLAYPVVRSVPMAEPSEIPKPGELVHVRHRQYMVEAVHPAPGPKQMNRLRLVCLDDDNQGRTLEVLWELELGARRLDPTAQGLGELASLDPPRHFGAYFHAIKWSCVTATDSKLFQAPFRAGIKIFQHQLAPLRKALKLPRVNVFIADDVGLGKTIEAGLVMQELILRQRLDLILIVAPAGITLQWRDEMERRFGLFFEIYDRSFVARRRKERGFGTNPWSTHNRFIVSYQTLRRPEHRDPLLHVIRERGHKSMLVLDEAHNVAPASAAKYAIDSNLTKMARDIAERFENRLFLSATPHNGHSNSFSALLEILDPQRFTRGVKVTGPESLDPIMVRRLKKDLRAMGRGASFPERKLVEMQVRFEDGRWHLRRRCGEDITPERAIGEGTDAELRLSQMLAEYTKQAEPAQGKKWGRGRLVFVNLQKRLLSSIEAFYRTLTVHARAAGKDLTRHEVEAPPTEATVGDTDTYGTDDDSAIDEEVSAATKALDEPAADAKRAKLLDDMLDLARRHRLDASAKALALLDWIREHQCAAVRPGGLPPGERKNADTSWTDRRLLVFTEYADTKRFLQQFLSTALAGTHDGDARILTLHGGMSDEARDEVQTAFNGDPKRYPVRILIATDAAREGVNLQGHCADLIHYDIPWNPARMEQRNGRIDRTLQPADEIRCMYFVHPQRPEDTVLRTLVAKVSRIAEELGSLSSVVMDRIDRVLADGIDDRTEGRVERASEARADEQTATEELEAQRQSLEKLRTEVDACAAMEEASRRRMEFDPLLLEDAIDVGCMLAGSETLRPIDGPKHGKAMWRLPELPPSWERTLDSVRPTKQRDEDFWEWRKRPLLPVLFEPSDRMSLEEVHLHLHHPFVRRILSRFLAQGYSAHDLTRVTVVRTKYSAAARVVAFGRLSLFGGGGTRLHDHIIPIVAPWLEGKGKTHLQPFASDADRDALVRFEDALREAPELSEIPKAIQTRLVDSARTDFATLWQHVEAAAQKEEQRARSLLADRGTTESEALRGILRRQRAAIEHALEKGKQILLELGLSEMDEVDQQRQFKQDQKHMADRLAAIERELKTEPEKIQRGYEVMARRLEPVGLVYLWPHNR